MSIGLGFFRSRDAYADWEFAKGLYIYIYEDLFDRLSRTNQVSITISIR